MANVAITPTKEAKGDHAELAERIERAARIVGAVWPLPNFVTINPLGALEDRPFGLALREMRHWLGASVLPDAATLRSAWERGRIDPGELERALGSRGVDSPPEQLLDRLAQRPGGDGSGSEAPFDRRADRIVSKWLTVFLDEGQAEWPMPKRGEGFYRAWRHVARHDRMLPDRHRLRELPASALETVAHFVGGQDEGEQERVLRHHMAALRGWVGRIKQRQVQSGGWQAAAPVTLPDYLAVRMAVLDLLGAPVAPPAPGGEDGSDEEEALTIAEGFLEAWEASERGRLCDALADRARVDGTQRERTAAEPLAQWVFCIDTRSEVFRRNLEGTGPHETLGFAGFFGLAIQHRGHEGRVAEPACPPILSPAHHVTEGPADGWERPAARARLRSRLHRGGQSLVDDLKHNVGAAFTFVEAAGPMYGLAMLARTLLPQKLRRVGRAVARHVPSPDACAAPDLDAETAEETALPQGMSLEDKVSYAETAFTLMGWRRFAPWVVLVGHAGESANNPFSASLHCGACAGRRGGPNARVLATLCNDPAVRRRLAERGVEIPARTRFVAAEHNTTTDEIQWFLQTVPEEERPALARLQEDAGRAGGRAATERASALGLQSAADGPHETKRRAADWSEVRPEWGLAGNAAFVIGPRALTETLDLGGRCFLHSYDWRHDPDGTALSAILHGPMLVTQWINTQYYFATVDNAHFGSGRKVTQSPVGNVGVVQGNGGDLMAGLPHESIADRDGHAFHEPLRLTVVVHAPADRVATVVAGSEKLHELIRHEWLTLVALDPSTGNRPVDVRQTLDAEAVAP